MSKTMIFSHVDADGILSARITQMAIPDSVVKFQHWTKFGLDEDTKLELSVQEGEDKFDNFIFLDLGTDIESIERASELHDLTGASITWLDHHPTDPQVLRQYQGNKDFNIVNTPDTCTSTMAHELYSVGVPEEVSKWQDLWAVLGTYGDVAQDTTRGKLLLDNMRVTHPELFGNQIFWSPKGGQYGYEIPAMLARHWNTVRRVTFHYGCPVALKACEEVEQYGSPFALTQDKLTEVQQARMPHLAIIKQWQDVYVSERKSVFSGGNMQYFVYDMYSASVFSHRWDLGGYVAGIKASDKDNKMSHFAINLGLPDVIKVTARNPNDRSKDSKKEIPSIKLDVGAVLSQMGGGGHAVAASAMLSKDTQVLEILRKLNESVHKVVK